MNKHKIIYNMHNKKKKKLTTELPKMTKDNMT